jgi:lipoprotein-anchoring transpeptidase ErfK/SrfK
MAGRARTSRHMVTALVAGLAIAAAGVVLAPSRVAAAGCDQYPQGPIILVTLADQHLTACQDGAIVVDTPVTTGRPALPTPQGSTSVFRKNSPWTMRSSWPRSSPYWYPPSRVEYTLWFRPGYAIHDAPWRYRYGPGTQAAGSHGCINVPRPAMDRLYRWAVVGTPVLVS